MRLIAILLLVLARPGLAAEIEIYVNPLGDPGHEWHLGDDRRLDGWAQFRADCYHYRDSLTAPEHAVLISGRIEDGDAERFAETVAPYAVEGFDCPRLVVLLDSGGGALLEAIRLGRAVGERGLATVVPPGFRCLSACVFVLAGGSFPGGEIANMVAFAGARIGLHQPQFDLGERQRQALAAAPDAPQLTYELAGAQWTEIYDFMINLRRNDLLLQLMLASPKEADRFNDLDSFEELFLAGLRLVDLAAPGAVRLPARLLLGPEVARHVCALPLIRGGSRQNFANAYATPLEAGVMVGLVGSEQFCLVTADPWGPDEAFPSGTFEACVFDRGAFNEFAAEEMPAYVAEFGVGAMGFFPADMFRGDLMQTFAVPEETLAETRSTVERFLVDNRSRLCPGAYHFSADDLQALGNAMWIDAACPTATRLCKSGKPFADKAIGR